MSLEAIAKAIIDHPTNAWAKERGDGPLYAVSPTARVVVIGQAPGLKAQESGIPWNDASGDNLRNWMGVSREQFYDASDFALLPMDFYYPGKGASGDLPPRKDFADLWHPQLLREMPDIRLTLLIGQYAQKHYLADKLKENLTETVRSYPDYLPEFMPLVHPSPLNFRWRARNPWFDQTVIPELRKLVEAILGA